MIGLRHQIQQDKHTPSGFSLVEVLVTLAMLGLLLTLGLMTSRNSARVPGNSREMAQNIAERLRLARAKAQAADEPVAMVFPSQEGSVPHSQSSYFISGVDRPRIDRVFDDSEEFSTVFLFVGLWDGPDNTLASSNQILEEDIDFHHWFEGSDYQFAFTPSGQVVTNNLPLFDGAYHLVVCSGVQFTPSSAPSAGPWSLPQEPSYFSLSRVAEPYTVVVGTSGDIRVERGVTAWSGSADMGLETTVPPAQPPQMTEQDLSSPESLSLEILPSQEEALLPPGTDAVVRNGEYLTFRATAERAGGGPLYCQMQARDPQGVLSGAFTAPAEQRMEWNAAEKRWEQVMIWSPTPEHPVGTRYTFTTEVEDRRGNRVSLQANAALIVEKTAGGRFLIQSTENLGPAFLAMVNDDGTQYRRLPQELDVLSGQVPLHFSPDRQSGVFKDTHGNTVTVDLETATTERIPHTLAWSWNDSSLTPEGSRFLVEHRQSGSPGETHFYVYSTYTGDRQRIYPSLGTPSLLYSGVVVAPDGRKIAYVYTDQSPYGDNYVVVEDWDQVANTLQNPRIVATIQEFLPNVHAAFSPDSSRLLISAGRPRSFSIADLVNGGLSTVNHNASSFYHSQAFDWSPDGTRIAYYTANDSIVIVEISTGQTRSFTIPDPDLDARYIRWSR